MVQKAVLSKTERDQKVQDFLQTLGSYIWIVIGTYFPSRLNRHGVAVVVMDADTGEIIARRIFGITASRAEEIRRMRLSIEKANRLRAHPQHFASNQSSDDKKDLHGGAIRIDNLIASLSGLGSKWDEAVLFVAASRFWEIPEILRMSVSFTMKGPNPNIALAMQFEELLKKYARQTFRPDFNNLVSFENEIIP